MGQARRSFGANLANRQAGEGRDGALTQIAGFAAVWFFFRSDCPYCEAQAPLLQILAERYGFAILPVSIDGSPLPGGLFPDYRRDTGQAARLGVVSTPALLLVKPDGPAFAPIAQGLLSLAQLQERITRAAVSQGWIGEDAMPHTRLAAPRPEPSLPEDPNALLALLRAHTRPPQP